MAETTDTASRTPWHLWLIGAVGLPWNGFGAYDYFMTQFQGAAYMRSAGMTAAQIAHIEATPMWMTADWAIGVWGAVAGTLLLLLRSRWAVPVFLASLLGLLISILYTYVLSDGGAGAGPTDYAISAVLTAGALFFLWYARRMVKQGVLR